MGPSSCVILYLLSCIGMEHAGIGPTHVNHFITAMNVPSVDPKLLRRNENAMGPHLERIAKKSCQDAAKEEIEKSGGGKGISMGYDCGWQKRGRAMNSITGVGHGIGCQTGKVIGYTAFSKRCATCYIAERLGKVAEKHECRKNFSKSSKAMEAEAVAEIGKDLKEQGEQKLFIIQCCIMDKLYSHHSLFYIGETYTSRFLLTLIISIDFDLF